MNLGVIGTGYVGLVTGACLSDFGHDVLCVDNDEEKIEGIRKGEMPIFEPGLKGLISKNFKAGRLKFETNVEKFVEKLDAIFIAVGTPTKKSDQRADLSGLSEVVRHLSRICANDQVLIIKSTVPVGTNTKVSELVQNESRARLEVVSNPEFLREGSAIEDFMKPDRVIVGLRTKKAKKMMAEIYRPLYLRDFPIVYTDPESAELIKYSSNAFLAMKISFINEVAHLCEKSGADVKEVAKGIGLDGRIGSKFLHAGPGYGGSCFPKDTLAFTGSGREFNAPQTIIEAVIKANNTVKTRMFEKIYKLCDNNLDGKLVAVFGVTFKPNTDDMREAPSLSIIPKLQEHGSKIRIVDPKGKKEGKRLLGDVNWYDSCYQAVKNANLVVILTEWNEFRALDLTKIAAEMKTPWIADLRNIYSKNELIEAGFTRCVAVGR